LDDVDEDKDLWLQKRGMAQQGRQAGPCAAHAQKDSGSTVRTGRRSASARTLAAPEC